MKSIEITAYGQQSTIIILNGFFTVGCFKAEKKMKNEKVLIDMSGFC